MEDVVPASPESGSAAPINSPTSVNSSLRNFLLSTLILPLPPLLIPELLLPPYDFPSFNSHRLDQELRLYTQYLRAEGTPDVLIIGSSRSLQGIDPTALQESLVKQGYPQLKIFNLGINGGTAKVNELLLLRILTPEQLPRLIIWADGSRAFNNGRLDLTYNSIVASAGYQRLVKGDRPIPSYARWDLPLLRAAANKAVAESQPASPAKAAPAIAADLDANGFQTVTDIYNPTLYYQRYPRVPGSYDADYQNFNLEGDQQAATVAIAQFAKSHNIPLVLVNLPLTADYLDPIRRNYEQQFRQHMQQLSQQEQFIFCDLSQQTDLMQNGYFADPSHINRYGARAIGTHLATVPFIPWDMFKADRRASGSEPVPHP
ncbi:MAG TPA: hypothetical protein V6C57_24900 [Coleofasciculaceae cyanobacterium]